MRCPNDSAKIEQGFLIHLISAEQFGVIAEIPEEPIELPERSFGAVQPARE